MRENSTEEPNREWVRFARLPDAPWLPLEIVLNFVQDGWAFQPSNECLTDYANLPRRENGEWRRQGSLMAEKNNGISSYDDPAISEFNSRLGRAGLNGRVRFKAIKYGASSTAIEEIPSAYFTGHHVFGPFGVSNPPIWITNRHGAHENHWESVTVERASFLEWLRTDYPTIAALHDTEILMHDASDGYETVKYEDVELEPPRLPTVGSIPLSIAALWIASEGGLKTVRQLDSDTWLQAYAKLFNAIAGGQVQLIGRSKGLPEIIPGHVLAGIKTQLPFSDSNDLWSFVFSETPYVEAILCGPEFEQWWGKHDCDDKIRDRWRVHYHALQVQSADVLKVWPQARPVIASTGVPGRPSSNHLVHTEYKRRLAVSGPGKSLAADAREMGQWLDQQVPPLSRITVGAMTNSLRPILQAYKSAKSP